MFTLTTTADPDWRAAVRALTVPLETKLELIAEAVGSEVTERLKALSAETRGWSKRTGQLEGSYGYEVKAVPGGAMLTLKVGAVHAIFLEARDGLFVLNGVADPGGQLERALLDAARAIAPDWEVRLRKG